MYNEKVFFDGLPKSAFGKHYNIEFRRAHRDPVTDRTPIITLNKGSRNLPADSLIDVANDR